MPVPSRTKTAARFHPLRTALPLVLVAWVVVLATSARPESRDLDQLVREGGVFFDPATHEPFTGVALTAFENDADVSRHLGLWSGAYRGPFESYFRSRNLSARESFRDGVRHGPFAWYYEDGALFEEGSYVDGRRDGIYRAYWESGDLYEEGTYVDGALDGPRRWYAGGRLIEMVTYRHGVIDGLYERYHEDGSIDLKGMLRSGSPCGVWLEADRTISYPHCAFARTE